MIHNIEIEKLKFFHYKQLIDVMKSAYHNWQGSLWSQKAIETLIQKFPEGQLVVIADNNVIGCALSIIVDYEIFGDTHTYQQITGNYTFNTHTFNGNVLYGIEIFIHPAYRSLRVGRRL